MSDLQRCKEILKDLIAFPTLSSDSNLEMMRYMAALLEDCGARVELLASPCGRKANLFATLGPDKDGGILLSGHSDVVPVADQDWSSDPFELVEREGRLYGRGSCDMKGFLAACLTLAPKLATRVGDRPLHFTVNNVEEVGCFGAQHLAAELQRRGRRPGIAIIGEPTEMRIIEGHKGCYEYSTHLQGLEGHGSRPELGVNAVEYAVRYVSRLLALKAELRQRAPEDSRFEPPWTTINVGALNGGTLNNVIAAKARVDWEMRPVQGSDADHVKSEMARYCDEVLLPEMRAVHPQAAIELEVIGEVAGLIPTKPNEAREIVAALTGANGADLVAFGTEAGIFQALGTDVVVCGPGSITQAHKADEYIALDQLQLCLNMLTGLGDHLHG